MLRPRVDEAPPAEPDDEAMPEPVFEAPPEDYVDDSMGNAIEAMLAAHPEFGPRETLHERLPYEAWPLAFTGKHSYTVYGDMDDNGDYTARIEVNLKCKHFRVIQKAMDAPPIVGTPNVPWAKHAGPVGAWEHTKKISGYVKA